MEQVRRILVNWIKGFEGRKLRCRREGRSLYRKAVLSQGARTRKKLLANTSWYKGAGNRKREYKPGWEGRSRGGATREANIYPPKTVLFVEHTVMGELGKRLRELMTRLAPILGLKVKVVKRAGSSLKSHFPQSSLWDGAPCGRENCITCTQGAEMLLPCTRKSLVHKMCAQSAGESKGEQKNVDPLTPSIYVGETSRIVQGVLGSHKRE